MYTEKTNLTKHLGYLFIACRILCLIAMNYCYQTGGYSTSDLINFIALYIPSTFLLLILFILNNQYITGSKKNKIDWLFFIGYTVIAIYIIQKPTSGDITRVTALIWLSCLECILDAYICKRLFLDRFS